MIILIVSLLLILLIVFFLAGNYFYRLALVPGTNRDVVFGAPHNEMDMGDIEEQEKDADNAWFEAEKEVVHITSFDGLKLHGWFMKQKEETHRYAIICHGYTAEGMQMIGAGKRFGEEGFSVLLPDARGHGTSEGKYIGMGWHDRLDILEWIAFLTKQDKAAEIMLFGVSMGAATAMMTAGEALPPQVKVIVEDCGYTSAWDEFSYQLKALFQLSKFPIMYAATAVAKLRAGFTLGEASAIRQLKKATVPILFVHGSEDTFVPANMLEEVYAAADVPKEKILVPGAGHGAASAVLGEEYWKRVFAFVFGHMTTEEE